MKKVLHVAIVAPGLFTSAPFEKAFLDNGFTEYFLFDFQLKTFEFGKERMRQMVIEEAKRIHPDLILVQVQNSEYLDRQTFLELSQISFVTNYTFDIRSERNTEWMYGLAPHIGLTCFSNQRDVDELKVRGYENSMVLQSSCDMEQYKPSEGWNIQNSAIFIGNNTSNTPLNFPLAEERKIMVDALKTHFPMEFSVFGLGWPSATFAMMSAEIALYQSHTIAICHNQFDEDLYTSDRIWRVMSTGALCLTKYFKGIETMFEKGVHLDWWNNFDELIERTRYYLDHPEERARVAMAGMDEVRSNHTWSKRIEQMLAFIRTIRKEPEVDWCTKLGAHAIDGVIIQPTNLELDGKICDCKKLKWVVEDCGCGNREPQLRAYQNI